MGIDVAWILMIWGAASLGREPIRLGIFFIPHVAIPPLTAHCAHSYTTDDIEQRVVYVDDAKPCNVVTICVLSNHHHN